MRNKSGKIIVMLLLALVLCFSGVFGLSRQDSVYAADPVEIEITIKYTDIDWHVAGYENFDQYYQSELASKATSIAGMTQTKGDKVVTIKGIKVLPDTLCQNAFNFYGYIPPYYTAVVANAEKKVSEASNKVEISFTRTGTFTPEETEKTGWYKGLINPVVGWLNITLWVIISVVLVAGMVYSIYLGVQLARADSEDKRSDAKKRMLWFILAFVLTTLVLVLINFFIANGEIITRLFN